MLKSLHHVTLRVNDFKAAVAWYRDVLGLEPVGLHDDPFCFMRLPEGDAMLAILGVGRTQAPHQTTPAILVDDLNAAMTALEARGVDFATRPADDDDEGYRMATLLDLEGNRIALFEWT